MTDGRDLELADSFQRGAAWMLCLFCQCDPNAVEDAAMILGHIAAKGAGGTDGRKIQEYFDQFMAIRDAADWNKRKD